MRLRLVRKWFALLGCWMLALVAVVAAEPSLKAAFKDDFLIGAAVSPEDLRQDGGKTGPRIDHHFNTITPCNCLKWEPFNPQPGVYQTEAADAFVDYGTRHGMVMVGHVLFWHSQTPDWVFKDAQGGEVKRDELLARMRQRVRDVATRYGKRIQAWDVVNETFENDGSLRKSKWVKIIGPDFVEQAFRIAGEELPPAVKLIYNDYGMEQPARRKAVVAMVNDLKGKGVRIDGVAMQSHWSLTDPSLEQIEQSILAYAATGVRVHISELDIDVLPRAKDMWNPAVAKTLENDPKYNPYPQGLPPEVQAQLAKRYADVFGLFLKHRDKVARVTFWGTNDANSWLNQFPIHGRTNHPLLFDRQGRPKPAFDAVVGLKKR